jgi:hypothetical protein
MPAISAERSPAAHETTTGLTPVPAVSPEGKWGRVDFRTRTFSPADSRDAFSLAALLQESSLVQNQDAEWIAEMLDHIS